MQAHILNAEKRELVGRKVKNLRKAGKIPATVYGKDVASLSVTINKDDFVKVYAAAGGSGVVELSVDSEKRPVLIHNVQRHPVTGEILHVEFHQVNLKEKVKTKVPVELVGEAKAVTDKAGVVLQQVDEVEVEALPTDLPEKIEVDVAGLAEVGQEIRVKDLKVPGGVEVLTDAETIIVNVGELVSKAAEEAAAAEAAAQAAAAAAQAPAEGEVPATAEGAGAPTPAPVGAGQAGARPEAPAETPPTPEKPA